VVEIDGRFTEQVLKSFSGVQINGKPVAIEAAGEARPRPSRTAAAPTGWAKPAYKGKGKPPSTGVRRGGPGSRPPEVEKARRKVLRKPWEK